MTKEPYLVILKDDVVLDGVNDWLKDCRKKAIEVQQSNTSNPSHTTMSSWEQGYPECGAIGGELTYEITHTSLGSSIVLRYNFSTNLEDLTKLETFNITNFDSW